MLEPNGHAPDLYLCDVEGESHNLVARASPLTLVIIFKTSCGTCHYAWKYYERLHRAYRDSGFRLLGISQHDKIKTVNFRAQYGATFPHLLDESFSVSRVFDPAFVPTGFLLDPEGTVVETFESWNKQHLNDLSERVAAKLGVKAQTIVRPEDNAVAHKMG